jgi:hypothetical protein
LSILLQQNSSGTLCLERCIGAIDKSMGETHAILDLGLTRVRNSSIIPL